MFGSRKIVGAAIIPDSAPSIAATPHPSASIQLARTPSRRLACRSPAAARMPRPGFVKRKKSQSSATAPSVTAMKPMSWNEKTTPPTSTVRVENALGEALRIGAPDPRGEAEQRDAEPERHHDDRQHRGALHRPDDEPLQGDAARERDDERQDDADPEVELRAHSGRR